MSVVVNKELLVREARRALPTLSPESQRRIRIGAEERLVGQYDRHLRQSWAADSTRMDRTLKRVSRAVLARDIVLPPRPELADSCRAALAAGLSFEEADRRFAQGRKAGTFDPVWRDPLWFPPHVVRAVLLEDPPDSGLTRPIPTFHGIWIVQVSGYRPFDLRSRPGYERRARRLLTKMLYRTDSDARRDSLVKARGYRFHPENCPALAEAVRAYLDSVQTARPQGGHLDQYVLRAPTWRLPEGERGKPICELDGSTITEEAFVRSLDDVDVQYWPRFESVSSQLRDTQARLDRFMKVGEARKMGIEESEAYQNALGRLRDEVLLDEFHDHILLQEIRIRPEEADSLYLVDPARWKIGEETELAAVLFPADEPAEAEEFLRRVQGGDARHWTEEAERLLDERIEGVRFLRSSDMLEAGKPADPPLWQPIWMASEGMAPGQIAGPVTVPDSSEVAIFRVITRIPERPLSPQTARVMAEKALRLTRTEARLRQILDTATKRDHVRTWPGRLGTPGGGMR